MMQDKLIRAWVALMLFSTISTVVALMIDRGKTSETSDWITITAGVVILGLSLIKGRIILSRYLGLETTQFWRRGFNAALTIYALVLLGLYLGPLL